MYNPCGFACFLPGAVLSYDMLYLGHWPEGRLLYAENHHEAFELNEWMGRTNPVGQGTLNKIERD